jgi:hypothetical protein
VEENKYGFGRILLRERVEKKEGLALPAFEAKSLAAQRRPGLHGQIVFIRYYGKLQNRLSFQAAPKIKLWNSLFSLSK